MQGKIIIMRVAKYFFACVLFQSFIITALQAQFTLRAGKENIVNAESSSNEWINFKANSGLKADRFILSINDYFQLGPGNNFLQHRQSTDENGNTHKRYSHFYKGYRVMYSELVTHEKPQELYSINGHVPASLNAVAAINISENEAFNKALNKVNAIQYEWQAQALSFANFLHIPKAEVVWVQKGNLSNPYDAGEYELAYKFDIVSRRPVNAQAVFVSTQSGNIIRVVQLMANCNAVSVATSFYGNRVISTTNLGNNYYRLNNDCNTSVLETVNWPHNAWFDKLGNSWTHDTMRAPATTLWAMQVTHNYFSGIHSYNGWDNGNGNWRSYENALFCYEANCTPWSPNNASFYRGYMSVGWGDTDGLNDDWNALDIIGHEFTHGISDTMAHLVYEAEPGALNESFSDIFGNTIQANQLGTVADLWKMGEDRTSSGGTSQYIRNMEDPNDNYDPDTYKGTYWKTTSDDNYGVHTNSGVQNFMYYLLVNGGGGTNDIGWEYKVEGIGIIPARRIAFKALVDYMDANSTHQTARNAWLSAAYDLYGVNSTEYKQVANAWFAVGVCSNGGEQLIFECGTRTAALANSFYHGFKYIFLGSPASCPLTINPASGLISYGAGNIITMSPGFVATQGSNFRATIINCNP